MKQAKFSLPIVLLTIFTLVVSVFACRSQDNISSTAVAIPHNSTVVAIPLHEVYPRKACPSAITPDIKPGSHIGLRISSELKEFETIDSLLFSGVDDYSHKMSHVVDGQGQHYFWLGRICYDENDKELIEVVDEIILPQLQEGDFASTRCRIAGEISILTAATGNYQKGITRAWTLESEKWKFEEVPSDRFDEIACR